MNAGHTVRRQQSNSLRHSLLQGGWSSPIDDVNDDVYLSNSVENDFPDLHEAAIRNKQSTSHWFLSSLKEKF